MLRSFNGVKLMKNKNFNEEFREEFLPIREEAMSANEVDALNSVKSKLEDLKKKHTVIGKEQEFRLQRAFDVIENRLKKNASG
jgi:hypothetical protein